MPAPRWLLYQAPGGSNLRNYGFRIKDDKIIVDLPLLTGEEADLVEATFTVQLAPSGQLEMPRWNAQPDKAKRLLFRSAHQDFSADLGGGEVLFLRRHLENRTTDELREGGIGPVWLKLVLDVDSQAPPEWLDSRGRTATPAAVHHFQTGLATKSKHSDGLLTGLRVLSVDLGLRHFASCSVFELVEGQPQNRLAFLADEQRNLWARHERSFVLAMPGETPDHETISSRKAAYDVLGMLHRDLSQTEGNSTLVGQRNFRRPPNSD